MMGNREFAIGPTGCVIMESRMCRLWECYKHVTYTPREKTKNKGIRKFIGRACVWVFILRVQNLCRVGASNVLSIDA